MQDPILTPIFLSGLASVGITGTTATVIAAGLSAIATTAITVGVTMALAPRPEDGHAPLQQPIPPRMWAVGKVRIAGSYMLYEEWSGTLFSVVALCGHEINSFVSIMLHDDYVTIGPDGVVAEGDDGRYGGESGFFGWGASPEIIKIKTRTGLANETAYDHIVAALEPQGIWTSNHRGDGQASIGMTVNSPPSDKFRKRLPHGIPQPSAIIEAARVWDFRNPAQDPDDPTTWSYSQNSALILAWHECFNEFGSRRDYHTALLPVLDQWKEEADVCDEIVPLASGGTEKRYECNGWASADQDPKVGRNSILATCDGWFCERGDGAILFVAGKFRESRVTTLTDADLCGYFLQRNTAKEDRINRLMPKFTYPATEYSTTNTDYWEDEDAQLVDGRPLAADGDYTWCHSWTQARRLGLREWKRLRVARRGSLDLRLSGLNSVYSRWVRIESPNMLPTLDGKIIENRSSRMSLLSGGFQMEFVQHPTDIDVWTPATDEGLAPPIPIKPDTALVPDPIGLTVVTEQRTVGGNVTALVLVARATPPTRSEYTFEAEYALDGTEDWRPMSVAAGKWEAISGPVNAEAVYDVRARMVGAGDTPGNWQPVPNVIVSLPPAALTGTSVTGGLGRATVGYTTGGNTPSATTGVKLYRAPAGVALDKTAHLVTTYAAAGSTGYSKTDGDASRTNLWPQQGFDATTGLTVGANWTVASSKASHASGSSAALTAALAATASAGQVYRYAVTLLNVTASLVVARLSGGATVSSAGLSTNGQKIGKLTATAAHTTIGLSPNTAFVGDVDDMIVFLETPTSAPQGSWDYYLEPINALGVAGPLSGPLNTTII